VDDLMYLKRGGRVSATSAVVGTLLKIKPVLHVDNNGKLINMAKVRGRKSSIEALVSKMVELEGQYDNQMVFISHGDCLEEAQVLKALVLEKTNAKEVMIGNLGAVIGSHAGPGTLALFFMGTQR
jgi:DegV family protein with EDD domain